MTNISSFNARLARLEAQRRGTVPGQRRLAEAGARLIAWANRVSSREEMEAFRLEIEAARRSAGR